MANRYLLPLTTAYFPIFTPAGEMVILFDQRLRSFSVWIRNKACLISNPLMDAKQNFEGFERKLKKQFLYFSHILAFILSSCSDIGVLNGRVWDLGSKALVQVTLTTGLFHFKSLELCSLIVVPNFSKTRYSKKLRR